MGVDKGIGKGRSRVLVALGVAALALVLAFARGGQASASSGELATHASANTWGDLEADASITYDSNSCAEVVAGTLTIREEAIASLLDGYVELVYEEGAGEGVSAAIDARLAEVEQGLIGGLAPDGSPLPEGASYVEGSLSCLDDDGNPTVSPWRTGFALDGVTTSDAALAAAVSDNGSVVLSAARNVEGAEVSIGIRELSYAWSLDYRYVLVVEGAQASGSDGGAVGGGNADEGAGGEAEESTATSAGALTSDAEASGGSAVEVVSGSLAGSGVWENLDITLVPAGAVSAHDWWEGVAEAIEPVLGEVAFSEELVYRGEAKVLDLVSTKPGLCAEVIYGDGAEGFVEACMLGGESGIYQLSISPERAFDEADGPKAVGVLWSYPNGEVIGKTTVSIGAVGRFEIDLGELAIELPFRLATSEQQMAAIRERVNGYVAERSTCAAASGEVVEMPEYVHGVSVSEEAMVTYNAACDRDVTFGSGEGCSGDFSYELVGETECEALANYRIVGTPRVSIKQMVHHAWADNNLQLSKLGAGDDTTPIRASTWRDEASWTREVPTATWAGHRLHAANGLPTGEDEFEAGLVLEGGDGIHEGISVLALDEADGSVVVVEGIGYQLDTTAPVLMGVELESSPSAEAGGMFFGGRAVTVSLSLVDAVGAPAAGVTASSSGLAEVDASYDDVESGRLGIAAGLAGDLTSGLFSFDVPGDAEVVREDIHITAIDKAGNTLSCNAGESRGVPLAYSRLVADAEAPVISASWAGGEPSNGSYYDAARTLTVEIDDAFFNYLIDYANDQAVLTVMRDGELALVVHPSDFAETSANHWSYPLPFTEDASWEISGICVQDLIGRWSNFVSGDVLCIDTTAPELSVSFDVEEARNGNYFNAARTATIRITERNFSEELVKIAPTSADANGEAAQAAEVCGWSRSGDVSTCSVRFSGPGAYTLSVEGQDLAGNELSPYSCPEFIVDTSVPSVSVEVAGVARADGQAGAFAGEAPASVFVHDANLDATSSTIEVTKVGHALVASEANPYSAMPAAMATELALNLASPGEEREFDGIYLLRVEAVDLAGNSVTREVAWSVNRFGSTYLIEEATSEMLGCYLRSSELADVVVCEVNPSGITSDASGSPSLAVELSRDAQTRTLVLGEDFTVAEDASAGWHEYRYVVSKENYAGADGVYRVLLHSVDEAANVSENTMDGASASEPEGSVEIEFAVDDTRPSVAVVGVEGGGRYESASRSAIVTFEDNLQLDHATICVNGETYAELGAGDLAQATSHVVTLAERVEPQCLSVMAYDAAGNASEELVVSDIVVSTNAQAFQTAGIPALAVLAVLVLLVALPISLARTHPIQKP